MKTENQTIHYFASKKTHYVIVSTDTRPVGEKIIVTGKKEARKLAKKLRLQAWNF